MLVLSWPNFYFPPMQYFNSGFNFGSDVAPNVGSSFIFMDYCPFESPFSVSVIGIFKSDCSIAGKLCHLLSVAKILSANLFYYVC